jgi:aryl-alcohol dehydrogenase-like predicted oxidoreductase
MPYNILDHRWENLTEEIISVKNKRDLTIHIRSSLLQGLLLSNDHKLWERANVEKPNEVIKYLNDMVKKTRCDSILELCIIYVRSLNWVDGIVIGMETVAQLDENLKLFSKTIFSSDTLKLIYRNRPILSENTLNPSNWSN